jgi:hypothetical protein
MSKDKKVTLKLDLRAAAAVRQVLFDAQKGYTYDVNSIPSRVIELREVINSLDESISSVVES